MRVEASRYLVCTAYDRASGLLHVGYREGGQFHHRVYTRHDVGAQRHGPGLRDDLVKVAEADLDVTLPYVIERDAITDAGEFFRSMGLGREVDRQA